MEPFDPFARKFAAHFGAPQRHRNDLSSSDRLWDHLWKVLDKLPMEDQAPRLRGFIEDVEGDTEAWHHYRLFWQRGEVPFLRRCKKAALNIEDELRDRRRAAGLHGVNQGTETRESSKPLPRSKQEPTVAQAKRAMECLRALKGRRTSDKWSDYGRWLDEEVDSVLGSSVVKGARRALRALGETPEPTGFLEALKRFEGELAKVSGLD